MDAFLAAIPRLTGAQAMLGVFSLAGIWALYRAQRYRGTHPYDIRDTLMDTATGKASLNAHILWAMVLMAIYVVVVRANRNEDPTTLVSTVLGIFVLGRLGAQAVAAFKPSADQPIGTVERETTMRQVERVPAADTPAPAKNAPKRPR